MNLKKLINTLEVYRIAGYREVEVAAYGDTNSSETIFGLGGKVTDVGSVDGVVSIQTSDAAAELWEL